MPHPLRRRRRVTLAAALAVGAVATTTLAACTPDASGAGALAQRYVDLIASADADDLEALWMASGAEPAIGRAAGQLLLDATERIEVLEVGDPSPAATSTSADGVGSDVEGWEAVQVPVRYALAGTEHDGVVVLAPLEDAPRGLERSWRVVAPLMGELQVPATGIAGLTPDVFVGGTRLEIDSAYAGASIPLFPGVYDVDRRAEPYLAAETSAVTVVAGASAALPDLPLEPTDETATVLQTSSDELFARCAQELIECPFDIGDLASDLGLPYPWQAEVTSAPTITLGDRFTLTIEGGALLVQGDDGPVTLTFSGSGPWFIDNQSWRPYLPYTDLALTVDAS
ncbi:hypothetical protein [Agrococcus jejuensis]|uniref:hypothetical protein n=1 Tax=Agrococcus jejuensis TaxID=399736 RepID=UPI0011AA2541|nr:hypothetical protein [Agrococcus jejuensis]